MSDEQASEKSADGQDSESASPRRGDPISEERQAELKTVADMQRGWAAQPEATRGDSVFQHLWLTGADREASASYS
jgi:hypothetical protein